MELDADAQPEREAVVIALDDNVSEDILDVQRQIKALAEKNVFQWRTFPIVLPQSVTEKYTTNEHGNVVPIISFKDLFLAPAFDELEEVAKDNVGDIKKLSSVQLENVRDRGEFDVTSLNFAGQVHTWRLTELLQKGTERARHTLLNDTALAVKLLIVTAKNRINSPFFSVTQGLKSVGGGAYQLLDCVVGLPHTSPGDIDSRLQEEHIKFLVAELNVKPSSRASWNVFCEYVKEKWRDSDSMSLKSEDMRPPLPPYRLQTAKGQDIDLRLFNRDLMNKCKPILKVILERESSGWYVKFKDRLISDMHTEEMSHREISEHVNRLVKEEYLRRVFDAISRSEDLEAISPALGKLLVSEAKATLVMENAVVAATQKLEQHSAQLQKQLSAAYPVRSRIKQWNQNKLLSFKSEFVRLNQWGAYDNAIDTCRQQELEQAVYFLQRDLTFMRDREPVLLEELGKVRVPSRTFTFSQRIWFPGNWMVKRVLYGETEVIPTVIVERAQDAYIHKPHHDESAFVLEKSTYWRSNTASMFWRWKNYLIRTWTWTWNAMFWFGIAVPWCSPVSLRALCYKQPFIPALQLNLSNGTLSPRESSSTETLRSRLSNLWQSVAQSRAQFEAEPDTGLLGKSLTRHVNRAWNYVMKGALGSLLLLCGFAPLCLVASTLSVVAALLSPVWMPFVTFAVHLFLLMVYDFDTPGRVNAVMYLFEAVVFRLLVLGVLQPISALLTAGCILPVASACVALFGVLRRGGRGVWDGLMYHLVISKQARVPTKDTFVAKRIAGPGLASNYFYQARPEQILAAVEAHLEYKELEVWEEEIRTLVEKPKHQYRQFVKQMFVPFSADLVHQGIYERVVQQTQDIIHEISYQVDKRKHMLATGLDKSLCDKIKLPFQELNTVQKHTTNLLQEFFPNQVFNRMQETKEEFWENLKLQDDDWRGLASHVLAEVFSAHFLVPLEETDQTVFRLEIKHLDLARYVRMIDEASVHDDLDEAEAIHTPHGAIDVDAPFFNIDNFSPLKSDVDYEKSISNKRHSGRWPWTSGTLNPRDVHKLQVPLPLMHPAFIAVLVYNRENDLDAIDVDDPLCRRILHAAEDTPYTDTPNTVVLSEESSSTPDYTTTHSESDVGVPRLAEQEINIRQRGRKPQV